MVDCALKGAELGRAPDEAMVEMLATVGAQRPAPGSA